jgi:hypothetical protein
MKSNQILENLQQHSGTLIGTRRSQSLGHAKEQNHQGTCCKFYLFLFYSLLE